MKIRTAIFALICAAGGAYYYYDNFYSKHTDTDNAAIEAAILDAQNTAGLSGNELAKRRLELEAVRLFPQSSESLRIKWVSAQLDAKSNAQDALNGGKIPENMRAKILVGAEEKYPLQYQSQLIEIKRAAAAYDDIERLSHANGIDAKDYAAKLAQMQEKYGVDAAALRDYMNSYVEALIEIETLKGDLPQEEFNAIRQAAFKTAKDDPLEAKKIIATQVSAKLKIAAEFGTPVFEARRAMAEETNPGDYAAQYKILRDAIDINANKGAVAMVDLKDAYGNRISTDKIFIMRSLTDSRAAVLASINGKKVLLTDWMSLGSGQTAVFDNGKETVKCSKIVLSQNYPVACLIPDAEPAEEPAVFMNNAELAAVNGLPVIAIGPTPTGVLNVDNAIPVVSDKNSVETRIPVKSMTSNCVLIDKNSGKYISFSMKTPRPAFVPQKGKLHEDDLLLKNEQPCRAYADLIKVLSAKERAFRNLQNGGAFTFLRPENLTSWTAPDPKTAEVQYALVEKLYKDNCDIVDFLSKNNFPDAKNYDALRPLWEKLIRFYDPNKSLGTTKNGEHFKTYFKELFEALKKDIVGLDLNKVSPPLRAEAAHQVELRKMIIEYIEASGRRGSMIYPK